MTEDAREKRGDALGDRMKCYELASRSYLPRRMPVIVRVDGKAFHSFTRRMARPFDVAFVSAMDDVGLRLCQNIEGAVFGYVQSDEVSVLLHNYKRLTTQPWFDNQIQKIVSVAASMAASTMTREAARFPGFPSLADFDARAFVLPEAEVCNYFLWRQKDAARNSLQMLARSLYSHAECEHKGSADLHEMCFRKGHNWNDLPVHLRRGRVVMRTGENDERRWTVDREPPLFHVDRRYVEQWLAVDDDERPTGIEVMR